jgi:general secretion pathway protein G
MVTEWSRLKEKTARKRRGFTLLELMVVLLILALLGTIAAPRVTKYLRKAKAQTAKIQVDALGAAVDSFHLDTGRFPSNDEGLKALMDHPNDTANWDGPYLKKRDSLIDPWGHPYLYRFPGQHGEYDVYTLGSDNREGGEGDAADVGNW